MEDTQHQYFASTFVHTQFYLYLPAPTCPPIYLWTCLYLCIHMSHTHEVVRWSQGLAELVMGKTIKLRWHLTFTSPFIVTARLHIEKITPRKNHLHCFITSMAFYMSPNTEVRGRREVCKYNKQRGSLKLQLSMNELFVNIPRSLVSNRNDSEDIATLSPSTRDHNWAMNFYNRRVFLL